MIDYRLRFSSEEEANAVLFEGEELRANYLAIDVIGTIYKPTGKTLQTEFGEIPEMKPVDGWHVNVRHNIEAPELEQYAVYPENPIRVWA